MDTQARTSGRGVARTASSSGAQSDAAPQAVAPPPETGAPSLRRRSVLVGAMGLAVLAAAPAPALGVPRATASARPVLPGGTAAYGALVATDWIATTYDLVLRENLSPPAAARVYAYTAVAMYEAVVGGMPGHRSLGGQLTGLAGTPPQGHGDRLDRPAAAVTAAAAGLRVVLPFAAPGTGSALDAAERDAVAARRAAGVPDRDLAHGVDHGRAVGRTLARWVGRDGHAAIEGLPYAPPTEGPWSWQSTPPNFRPAVEPHWGLVRPLVMRRADEIEPEPPVPFSTEPGSAFHDQAMAPYLQSFRNGDEHRAIARFWTDNPGSFTPPLGTPTGLPSGHWMLIAAQGVLLRGGGLDMAAEVLALTGIALHEAFLSCWTWKYRFNLLRPVTYVNRYIDPSWTTYVNSPQFPEHTSGHSVASPAAATVLTDRLGVLPFTDRSHDARGHAPRSFESFDHAAREAAQSRLYGGIHFPHAIEVGLDQGAQVGALVLRRVRTRR